MQNKTLNIHTEDSILIEQSLLGSKEALEYLIKKYQNWIYNTALSFVADTNEAADLTQEVLIKIVTKLDTFKQNSNFKTWVYRILKNHFLNMERSKHELNTPTFEKFGQGLDQLPNELLSDYDDGESKLIIKEAKMSCMKAMLVCLSREQRLIYIIGELFEFNDAIGSEIMEISKSNFRVKLHRAKKQLYNFMDYKCGLINKKNPCRCARKTAGFIKKGYVDPINLHFQKNRISTISKVVGEKIASYENGVISEYQKLYQEHPFLKSPDKLKSIKKLLSSKTIKETFDFN